jgi:hypothetical protein
MLIEIIVEGATQREGGKVRRIDILNAAALLAGGIARRIQRKPSRCIRQEILREGWRKRHEAADQDENFR